MLKRLFSIITISLVITGSFFSVYCFDCTVYADSTTDEWMDVTSNSQLVDAFRYYCKSRDLTIEGSVADAITTFTTKSFNGICNTLGIDVTALQAELKYQTDGNLGTRFLFSTTGIDAYNRIFSQFLQDNDIAVGDEVDKNINDGEACGGQYLWKVNIANSMYNGYSMFNAFNFNNYVQLQGGYYQYSNLLNQGSGTLNFDALGVTINVYNVSLTNSGNVSSLNGTVLNNSSFNNAYNTQINGSYVLNNETNNFVTSYAALARNVYNNHIILFVYTSENPGRNYKTKRGVALADLSADNQNVVNNVYNVNVTLTTNNNTINNNTYEGDTIINNNGDTNNYPETPDIPDPNPNPTPDPPTIPDSDGWQDFTLPEMPNDWLIYGMERKFPFDIPFNIMFALSLLNHEPEIPKFEGDIDLKVCTWHYDIDLTPFDDIATILRRFEVLAFIIGLAILTKNLIDWG